MLFKIVALIVAKKIILYLYFSRRNHELLCLNIILNRLLKTFFKKKYIQVENYLSEYLPILIFIIIGFAIAIGMTTLSFVVGDKKPDNEKLSAYECGFEAFDDARGRFDVRFYLVAILFIIFDLEVAFLFPWAISLGSIGVFGFWSMMIFLLILTIGFIYEWKKGALEWE